MIKEPFLPIQLEKPATEGLVPADWHDRVLVELAEQLGMPNDFYFPLLGAVEELQKLRRLRDGLVEVLRAVNPYVDPRTATVTPTEQENKS